MPKYKYLGKATQKVDALERVTGKAAFGADIHLPGMLHGKVLRSPHPHAIIKAIDYGMALKLEGVKAVVTSKDLPSLEDARASFGGEVSIDQEHLRKLFLAHDKVLFEGHPIAAVAATSLEIAEQALELIKVEYEVLPPVEDAFKAMQPNAPLLHPYLYPKTLGQKPKNPGNVATIMFHERGDAEKGFAEADVVVEESFETAMVHQVYIEPQVDAAQVEEDGKVTLWTANQGIFNVQSQLSSILNIPLGSINVVPMEIGGGFGGKIITYVESLTIMLSQKAGRPVKMVMSREEVFKATGPGSPGYFTIKVGAKKNGKITAAYIKMIHDCGAFPGGPTPMASLVSFGPYNIPSIKVDGYDVVTNKPRVQAYRAPGGTPVNFSVESTMNVLADKLGVDPLKFRMQNYAKEGDYMVNDQRYNRIGVKAVLDRVVSSSHWNTPWEGPNRGRGMALGFWIGAAGTSSALVLINSDGSATGVSGQVDLTGTRTSTQQIIAEELQMPLEKVNVKVGDTDSTPYTMGSFGSRTTYSFGTAVYRASRDALAQMKARAATQLKVNPEDVEYAEGRFWSKKDPEKAVSWNEVARSTITRGEGVVTGRGTVTGLGHAPEFTAQIADVEVDPETGKVYVKRFTAIQDAGLAINPMQVEGQIQGGVTQGIGWGMSEYYYYDKGKLRNASFLDYRMPTSLDVPMIDIEIVEVPASEGPYGVRGVGEVSIVPPPAAIAEAIYRATGVRMNKLPMTPEAVLWAIKTKDKEREPVAANGDS
ncbi:MAG: xanthine dehydrogenase family protein molybdopterin-binding subunit [Chloroflexi bacterium]|nr:xanthine dehydrogenase family protein molybdopterin-binding subunit [Chloroflexota bacterium]